MQSHIKDMIHMLLLKLYFLFIFFHKVNMHDKSANFQEFNHTLYSY